LAPSRLRSHRRRTAKKAVVLYPLIRRRFVAREGTTAAAPFSPMTVDLGILLAVACALATNVAFLFKHRGARAAERVDPRHPLHTARALFGSRWFLAGMLVATGAWALHVAALALAPLSVVQTVLAAGVALIAVMAERLFGVPVGRRQWWGLALTACGLVLIAATMPAPQGAHSSFTLIAMIAFEGTLFGLGGLLILGPRVGAPAHHRGVMLGAASGILFGVSDVAIKALSGLVSPWLLMALAASLIAFYASARGLQIGTDPVATIAVTSTAANIAGITGGILVFGDPLHGDAAGLTIQAFAFILVVAASAMTPAPLHAPRAEA